MGFYCLFLPPICFFKACLINPKQQGIFSFVSNFTSTTFLLTIPK
ncbi:hypothetical protein HMPREF1419_00856 [Helicobacter pylori GAM263BFi]|nr:hypothetical protein HMPREF1419_00856 [Helicobacter pylori GAM263BFi]